MKKLRKTDGAGYNPTPVEKYNKKITRALDRSGFSLDDIQNMTMEEYAEFRERIMR